MSWREKEKRERERRKRRDKTIKRNETHQDTGLGEHEGRNAIFHGDKISTLRTPQ